MIPVLIIAYNRPRLLNQTIRRLSQNYGADETELYIIIDGNGHGVGDIDSKYTRKFKNINVKKRRKHLGLRDNVINSVSETIKDKLIVVEDDIVTHKQFLVWMNYGMNYPEDPVFQASITGYRRNYEAGLHPYAESWTWGTSKRHWDGVDWDMNGYSDQWKRGPHRWHEYALSYKSGNERMWAIAWCWYHKSNRLCCLRPAQNLVKHVGDYGTNVGNTSVEDIYPKEVPKLSDIWWKRRFE